MESTIPTSIKRDVLDDCEVLTTETWSCKNAISIFGFETEDVEFVDGELISAFDSGFVEKYRGGIGKSRWYYRRRTCNDYCSNTSVFSEDGRIRSDEEIEDARRRSNEILERFTEQRN